MHTFRVVRDIVKTWLWMAWEDIVLLTVVLPFFLFRSKLLPWYLNRKQNGNLQAAARRSSESGLR